MDIEKKLKWQLGLVVATFIIAITIWVASHQRSNQILVLLNTPVDCELLTINGLKVANDEPWTYLPEGPTTFVYKIDNKFYSYTVWIEGGGEIYLDVSDKKLQLVEFEKGH